MNRDETTEDPSTATPVTGHVELARPQDVLPGLLHILPLGMKMLRKGKIPNPFGHTFPGLSQIRALIQRVRRATPST